MKELLFLPLSLLSAGVHPHPALHLLLGVQGAVSRLRGAPGVGWSLLAAAEPLPLQRSALSGNK